jgi:hypothetical protein
LLALVETGDEDPGEGGGLDEASGAYDQVAVIKTR